MYVVGFHREISVTPSDTSLKTESLNSFLVHLQPHYIQYSVSASFLFTGFEKDQT